MSLRLGFLMVALAGFGWASPVAAQRVVRGDCSLTVDGKTYVYVKRTCRISLHGNGGFSINTLDDDERVPRRFYFAYLTTNGDGTATVHWNGSPKALHAHTSLGGDFRRKGGCWSNRRARVCAFLPRR